MKVAGRRFAAAMVGNARLVQRRVSEQQEQLVATVPDNVKHCSVVNRKPVHHFAPRRGEPSVAMPVRSHSNQQQDHSVRCGIRRCPLFARTTAWRAYEPPRYMITSKRARASEPITARLSAAQGLRWPAHPLQPTPKGRPPQQHQATGRPRASTASRWVPSEPIRARRSAHRFPAFAP